MIRMLALSTAFAAVFGASAGVTYTMRQPDASPPASSVDGSGLAGRLLGRTFTRQSCDTGTWFGPDVVATLAKGQVFSAGPVAYAERDGRLEVERTTGVETYEFGPRGPAMVAIRIAGVDIRPSEVKSMRECVDVPDPVFEDESLEQPAPPPLAEVERSGAMMALVMRDERAVRTFLDRGVDLDVPVSGKTLTEWSALSSPAIRAMIVGGGDDPFRAWRDDGQPWVEVPQVPAAMVGVYSRICRWGGVGIDQARYVNLSDDAPPEVVPYSAVWRSGNRYRIHARGQTIQIYEKTGHDAVTLRGTFLESGAPLPGFKEVELPRCG